MRGYSGSTRVTTTAGVNWPPEGSALVCWLCAGGAGAGAAGFGGSGAPGLGAITPGRLTGLVLLERPTVGASGRSAWVTGRSRCANDSVLNFFNAGRAGASSTGLVSSAAACCVSAGVWLLVTGLLLLGVVLFVAAGLFVAAFASAGSANGEGRGSRTRSDSLVVLALCESLTSIWKLTSPVMGGYRMLPVRT